MNYRYRVSQRSGEIRSGQIEAASVNEAEAKLREPGAQILEIEEITADAPLLPRRVTKQELIYVTAQLAIMVETGVTLSAALGGIVQQEENSTLRKVLAALKNDVENGENFSDALAKHPRLFDRTYITLIKASEATGALGAMLERIAVYLRKELETRGKVRAAMAYPTVMLVIAVAVTIFLLTYILPKFTPLFKSRGTKLPGPTLLMMNLSDGLLHYWWAWLALAAGLIAGFIFLKRTENGRTTLDWLKINAPLFGPLMRKVTISRSVRTLGAMLGSGVPMLESIRLAAEVSGNVHYERLWNTVLDEVTGGRRICEVLQRSTLFPRVLVQMIACGEETAKLDMVLERVSGYYDQEVETSIKATTSMIEPIMISVMGVVVGTIGLALMLPIFSLSKQP